MRAACVAVFFVPLMAVGPEVVLAAHNEAMLYQTLSAAGLALGEHNNIVVVYTYTYDANGSVGAGDLAILLASWGSCPGCPADLDGDDVVGPTDLATLLGAWGTCP